MLSLIITIIIAVNVFALLLQAAAVIFAFLCGSIVGRLCLLGLAYWAWQVFNAMPSIGIPAPH